MERNIYKIGKELFITNDEDIKDGDWCLDKFNQIWKLENKKLIAFDSQGIKRFSTHNILGHEPKKIILTDNKELIKDGIQSIPDEFLEWFVKNPSCESVEIEYWQDDLDVIWQPKYSIIIPKEEPKQLTDLEIAIKLEEIQRAESKEETFNSKRGLKELQLKDPNNCAYYEEIGCIKDVCDCYTLVAKQEALEHKLKLLVNEWQERQINYETSANNFIEDHSNNRKFTYKAMATRDCWKELLKLIENEK